MVVVKNGSLKNRFKKKMFHSQSLNVVLILFVKLAFSDEIGSIKLSDWFQNLAATEILPFGGKLNVLSSKNTNVEPFIQNVECSDDPNVSENFYFESGKITSEGKLSGHGTLYIFDRLEGEILFYIERLLQKY